MPKQNPSSVTLEEAVARMVNMDYIPEGFTLSDMTSAFKEVAEVAYDNARSDRLSEEKLATLEARMDSCRARHSLVLQLLDSLKHEIENPNGSLIVLADDASMKPRLTLGSVSCWAATKYGIGIPEWSHTGNVAKTAEAAIEALQASTIEPKSLTQNSPEKNKLPPRLREQEQALLESIIALGYDPKSVPINVPGKAGVKAAVRRSLKDDPLFAGTRVFNKAWDRLRGSGELAN